MTTTTAPVQYSVSVSPHIRSAETTARIIWTVNACLAPAAIMGAWYFGLKAVLTMALCIGAAVGSEYLYQRLLKKKITINDGSAFLTGLLLAFNLPPQLPWYVPVLGSAVAILLAKQLFGGMGYTIFNPALLGRAFLLITFPKLLTTWNAPTAALTGVDTVTCATPLNILKLEGFDKLIETFGSQGQLYLSLLTGNRGGCLGETCIIALLAGGLFLIHRGYISWHIPASYLGTVMAVAWIAGGQNGIFTGDPLLHFLSGGIVLGAFFMATDYVTSPATRPGKLLFGAGCGLITMLIRLKGGYPEGCMFSILIMNCFSPLIDRGFRSAVFGKVKGGKKK